MTKQEEIIRTPEQKEAHKAYRVSLRREERRQGILHDCLLEGQYCVTFSRMAGDTESQSFACYPTKHKTLLEIGMFENWDIYKKLAMHRTIDRGKR